MTAIPDTSITAAVRIILDRRQLVIVQTQMTPTTINHKGGRVTANVVKVAPLNPGTWPCDAYWAFVNIDYRYLRGSTDAGGGNISGHTAYHPLAGVLMVRDPHVRESGDLVDGSFMLFDGNAGHTGVTYGTMQGIIEGCAISAAFQNKLEHGGNGQ